MKKIFFFFAMLASVTASATVTVTPISTDYSAQKVTFKVEWTGTAHNNRVWVWVDLCPVAGSTASTFQQAVISEATANSGSIATVSGNQRGFYVTTNPSTVTATLSNATGQFNWCVYGSDYPPNATSYNAGTYTLKGTPPFVITGNGTIQDDNKYVGTVINSLTDATGYPGGVGRDIVHNGGTCAPGLTAVGSYCRDLVADNAWAVPCSAVADRFIETKKSSAGTATWANRNICPSGWHVISKAEAACTCAAGYDISTWLQYSGGGDAVCVGGGYVSWFPKNSWQGTDCIPKRNDCFALEDWQFNGWTSTTRPVICAR